MIKKEQFILTFHKALQLLLILLEPVHIKIASKIIAKVRFPKYRTSSLS